MHTSQQVYINIGKNNFEAHISTTKILCDIYFLLSSRHIFILNEFTHLDQLQVPKIFFKSSDFSLMFAWLMAFRSLVRCQPLPTPSNKHIGNLNINAGLFTANHIFFIQLPVYILGYCSPNLTCLVSHFSHHSNVHSNLLAIIHCIW